MTYVGLLSTDDGCCFMEVGTAVSVLIAGGMATAGVVESAAIFLWKFFIRSSNVVRCCEFISLSELFIFNDVTSPCGSLPPFFL